MGQGQVGNDSVLGSRSFGLFALEVGKHLVGLPGKVVMAEHAPLGVASCSTSVD